jgi:hypothetical protein
MNPTIPQGVIDRAMEADPAAAAAEWLAQFRTDVESFISREAVEAVVVPGRLELPPVEGVQYQSFCDPSGGSSDSMTMAIAHEEKRDGTRYAVLDLVREVRPPFSPEQIVADFAEELRRFSVSTVEGDRYGAAWVSEQFSKAGIRYKPAEKPKSDLYREFLPVINSGQVELLDNAKLISQLCALERRTARGGRDSIDHGPNGRDDVINSVAGVTHLLLRRGRGLTFHDLYGDGGSCSDYDPNGGLDPAWRDREKWKGQVPC